MPQKHTNKCGFSQITPKQAVVIAVITLAAIASFGLIIATANLLKAIAHTWSTL